MTKVTKLTCKPRAAAFHRSRRAVSAPHARPASHPPAYHSSSIPSSSPLQRLLLLLILLVSISDELLALVLLLALALPLALLVLVLLVLVLVLVLALLPVMLV